MSIEKNLERIATALEAIVELECRGHATPPVPLNANPFASPEEQFPAAPAPVEPVKATPAPTPAPASAFPPAPFADHKALSVYVMGKYRSLGPVKGAQIQNVLSELGLKNINEVKPEQYAEFYAKVEAL